MAGAWGTYGGQEKCLSDFGGETWGKDLLGNLGVEIKMFFTEVGWEGLCCFELARDTNTVMERRVQ